MSLHNWILTDEEQHQTQVKLICFHHAGGSASSYSAWSRILSPEICLGRVQLPGRDPDSGIKPYIKAQSLAPELLRAISRYLHQSQNSLPYAFYGHSLGAIVAFELARTIRANGLPEPVAMFVSGRRAPQLPLSFPALCLMPELELIEKLGEMGGMSKALLSNSKWCRYFLPTMRADLEMSDLYQYEPGLPFCYPIYAFKGNNDPILNDHEVQAWEEQTTSKFVKIALPGAHFFTADGTEKLVSTIALELGKTINRSIRNITKV